jgi:hypothetical protein
MTKILLDNSTIKSVFATLGLENESIKVGRGRSKHFYNNIASTELFFESIFLFDEIIIPRLHSDNYPNFAEILNKNFSTNIFKSYILESKLFETIEEQTFELLTSLSSYPNKIDSLLKKLKISNKPIDYWETWDAYYTSGYSDRYFAGYKFQKIELVDREVKNSIGFKEDLTDPERIEWLLDTVNFNKKEDTMLFIWLVYKTKIYSEIGNYLEIPYLPNPSRNLVWSFVNSNSVIESNSFNHILDNISNPRLAIAEEWKKMGFPNHLDLKIPPFFSYILETTGSLDNIMYKALKMRETKKVKSLREYFVKLNDLYKKSLKNNSGLSDVFELLKEISSYSEFIANKMTLKNAPTYSAGFSLFGFGLSKEITLPDGTDKKIDTTENKALEKVVKPYFSMIKDINKVTSNIWNFYDFYHNKYENSFVWEKEMYRFKRSNLSKDELSKMFLKPYKTESSSNKNFLTLGHLKIEILKYMERVKRPSIAMVLIDYKDLDKVNQQFGFRKANNSLGLLGRFIINETNKLFHESLRDRIFFSKIGDLFVVLILIKIKLNLLDRLKSNISLRAKLEPYENQITPSATFVSEIFEPVNENDLNLKFVEIIEKLEIEKELNKNTS